MTDLALRVIIVGIAAYRLARVVAVDSITEPARSCLFWAGHADPDNTGPIVTSRVVAWAYALVSCPFCVGWWLALLLWFAWPPASTGAIAVGALAAAGVASLCSSLDASRG